MCFFVDDWKCKFEGDEIPLEVCKTCIEARSSRMDLITVKPSTLSEGKGKSKIKAGGGDEKIETFDEERKRRRLKELDNRFSRGKLTVDEYIEKRKELNI